MGKRIIITFELDSETRTKLKKNCLNEGTTMKSWLEKLVIEKLGEEKK